MCQLLLYSKSLKGCLHLTDFVRSLQTLERFAVKTPNPNSDGDQASGAAAASQSIIDVSKTSSLPEESKVAKAVTSDGNRNREVDVVNAEERTVQV